MKGKDGVGMLARRIHGLNTLLDSIPELADPVVVPAAQFFKPRPKAAASGPTALIPAKRGQATPAIRVRAINHPTRPRICLRKIRWNAELARGLTGKKKAAATRKATRLHLTPGDFDNLRRIVNVMSILQEATLDLSKKGVPTICKVLPLYKIAQVHLEESLANISDAEDTCNLCAAIRAGLAKLNKHTERVLVSDYPLVGAVLHPSVRLSYFQDPLRSND
ncbi:hypothetical protein FB451DRAFT_1228382 [Mycena latifolia]|nr:hypothetical protein FB451DRAFT_1228382 [Mycena latifolia]